MLVHPWVVCVDGHPLWVAADKASAFAVAECVELVSDQEVEVYKDHRAWVEHELLADTQIHTDTIRVVL